MEGAGGVWGLKRTPCYSGKFRCRRVSPIASVAGDGLLPDHRPGAQPQREGLVFCLISAIETAPGESRALGS